MNDIIACSLFPCLGLWESMLETKLVSEFDESISIKVKDSINGLKTYLGIFNYSKSDIIKDHYRTRIDKHLKEIGEYLTSGKFERDYSLF